MQNRPKTAKPLTPPSGGTGLDIVAILQESAEKTSRQTCCHAQGDSVRQNETPEQDP